ncbi:serine/threonine-protein kinase hal4 [Apiospora sp. TS-2023a]
MAKAQLRTRDGVLPVFERRARGENRTRGRSLRKPPAGGFYFGAVPNSAITREGGGFSFARDGLKTLASKGPLRIPDREAPSAPHRVPNAGPSPRRAGAGPLFEATAVRAADCFFKQLERGVGYLHDVSIAHCDLKPENLLLPAEGRLKISNFDCNQRIEPLEGSGSTAAIRILSGGRGSKPYIAPEEYTQSEFDRRAADVWPCGVIYMQLRPFFSPPLAPSATGRHILYSDCRAEEGYPPIEVLEPIGLPLMPTLPMIDTRLTRFQDQCRNDVYSISDALGIN